MSIKPSAEGSQSDMRTLPDGTFRMTHLTIRSILRNATPSPVRDYVGVPDWVDRERYDIVAKPPAGATPEQRAAMWRAMFADRMRLVGHVERQERDTLGLRLARSNRRLGPALTESTVDCAAPEWRDRCRGSAVTTGPTDLSMSFVSVTLDAFADAISYQARALVNNRTGLDGRYALTLSFARPGTTGSQYPAFETALREQLWLTLEKERSVVPVFVIEHMDRPSPN